MPGTLTVGFQILSNGSSYKFAVRVGGGPAASPPPHFPNINFCKYRTIIRVVLICTNTKQVCVYTLKKSIEQNHTKRFYEMY